MADCFSLQSIKEYVEDLRAIEAYGEMLVSSCEAGNYADAIEALLVENEQIRMQRVSELGELYGKVKLLQDENKKLKEQAQRGSDYHILKSERDGFKQENAKLKAERDAAVEDIIIACRGERTLCGMCGNKNCEYAGDNQTYCYKCTKYKWRGVKEAEDATD